MIKTKGLLVSLLIIAMLALTACGSSTTAGDNNQTGEPAVNTEEVELAPVTVIHELGEAVVPRNPERVIVFDYATLDILDAMGVDVVGLPKGSIPEFLSKYNDDKYENLGSLKEPNFEKIYELKPDVIFISGRQADLYEDFAKIAPTVHLTVDGGNYMESVKSNVGVIGEIFNKEDAVAEQLKKIDSEIKALNEKVTAEGKNALVVLANDGNISAYGEGSRFGIIHSDFGFVPVDEKIQVTTHGNSISFEYILEKNPDYIFIVDRAATTGGSVSAKQIFDNDIVKQTEAYKNGKIVYLNSQVWYVASGGLTGTLTMVEDIQSGL